MSIEQIKEAVEHLFSINPPKKHLTTQFIGDCVKEYLQLAQAPAAADMIAALREVEHCVARPMTRQKGKGIPEIRWVFVTPPVSPKKKSYKRPSRKKKDADDPSQSAVFNSLKMHKAG